MSSDERREKQEAAGGRRAEEANTRPLFATGEVVGDYTLLYTYWRHAGEKAAESVLRNEDFEELRRIVQEEGEARLDKVIERLRERMLPRVDAEAAEKAAREYYGAPLPREEARKRIAEMLAGWLIEAASQWNIIRLRRRWEHGAR